MIKRLFTLLITALFFISSSKGFAQNSAKPSILVSIAPYAFFAKKIAGDTIDIQTLVPPGTNIHIYEPSPKSVENNSKSLVWFRIDEPIEVPIVKALKERAPQMKMVNLQEGLPIMSGDAAIELNPGTGHHGHACSGHHHHDRDLHTWVSPKLALIQAKKMADELINLFPENASLYSKNFNQLKTEMVDLEKEIEEKLAPLKGSALLLSHPAFGYFCRDFGLIQLSVEHEGKDPRPKDVKKVIAKAKAYKVRCVFTQEGFNNRGAQLIGKKLGLPIYMVDPYAMDYLTNMRKITEHIAK